MANPVRPANVEERRSALDDRETPLAILPSAAKALPTVDARSDQGTADSGVSVAPALLLPKRGLARELGVSTKTIDRLDQTGKIPRAIRVGNSKRWVRADIVEWIASRAPDRKTFEANRRK